MHDPTKGGRVTAIVHHTSRNHDYLCARIEGGETYVTLAIEDDPLPGMDKRPRRRDRLTWEGSQPGRASNLHADRNATYKILLDNPGPLTMDEAVAIVVRAGGREPGEPLRRV